MAAGRTVRCALITVSDQVYAGERTSTAAQKVRKLLGKDFRAMETMVLPLDRAMLVKELCRLCEEGRVELILTLGGAGAAPTDCVREATLDCVNRTLPGIPETLRRTLLSLTPEAILDRSTAGVREGVLVVNLPGETEALGGCLPALIPLIKAALEGIRDGKE